MGWNYIIIGTSFILLYGVINLMRKNEKLEKIIDEQNEILSNLSQKIQNANISLEEIDNKGTFKSDDEVGWFFENLKDISNNLNNYINGKIN